MMLKIVYGLPNNDRYSQVVLQKLIKKEWESVKSKETAEKKLRLTNFQSLAKKRGLVGLVYQMSATTYKGNGLSDSLEYLFNGLIEELRLDKYLKAVIITPVEKRLGYERQRTIKILLKNRPNKPVCYISANIQNYKSFERTWELVSFDMDRGDVPFTKIFEEAGVLEEVLKIYE